MKKRKKPPKKGEPRTITRAITHIGLERANPGKLAALDELAEVYLALMQQYVTLFCDEELPNGFRAPCFPTALSERWQRVAIQQAAGIAKSWRTNRANAYQAYLDALAEYQKQREEGMLKAEAKEPAMAGVEHSDVAPTLHSSQCQCGPIGSSHRFDRGLLA